MGLRMKNFKILAVHWKIWHLGRAGGSQKTDVEGVISLKKGVVTSTVCRFRGVGGVGGGLGRKRGWCFWGGLIPRCTLCKCYWLESFWTICPTKIIWNFWAKKWKIIVFFFLLIWAYVWLRCCALSEIYKIWLIFSLFGD